MIRIKAGDIRKVIASMLLEEEEREKREERIASILARELTSKEGTNTKALEMSDEAVLAEIEEFIDEEIMMWSPQSIDDLIAIAIEALVDKFGLGARARAERSLIDLRRDLDPASLDVHAKLVDVVSTFTREQKSAWKSIKSSPSSDVGD